METSPRKNKRFLNFFILFCIFYYTHFLVVKIINTVKLSIILAAICKSSLLKLKKFIIPGLTISNTFDNGHFIIWWFNINSKIKIWSFAKQFQMFCVLLSKMSSRLDKMSGGHKALHRGYTNKGVVSSNTILFQNDCLIWYV